MALRDQPYLPLYIQDFMTDEKLIECSAESTGVYIRILCMMHKSKEYGKILLKQKDKQNTKQIKNFACKVERFVPYTIDVIERSLTELIEEDVLQICGDDLCQKRMIKDNDISLKRSEAGKKGVESKKFAEAKVQANSESENENENKDNNKGVHFEIFWDLYNKKIAIKKCIAKWKKLKPDVQQKIIDSLPEWLKQFNDKQFQPYPETYLNQERWNDEITIKSNGSPSHPNFYNQDYERKLNQVQTNEYHKHLESIGWTKTYSGTAGTVWHKPSEK